jgi:hypothetical protein
VRGLDSLCVAFGFTQQNLLQELSGDEQDAVREVLSRAAGEIRQRARQVALGGRTQEAARLSQIAQRSEQTPVGKDNSFGIAVIDLLARFGLKDADVADRYFQSRTPPKSWSGVLSRLRGATLHEGGLDMSDAAQEVGNVVAVWQHLHDVLGRIVLKMVGYSGEYQPTVIHATASEALDWVEALFNAQRLGYQ